MATKTTNYHFELPEENDFYDIHLENANMKKIDTALQENKQNINNHKNNTDIHLSEEQIEKIDSALQPTENAVKNNFVKYGANGTIADSGFNGNSFTPANHVDKSVYSQNGVHNLRYHNEQLQVFDGVEWIDVSGKSFIQVYITTRSGSVITATNGESVITGEAVDDLCIIKLPTFGDWRFTATLNGVTSEPVILNVDTVKKYEIIVSVFRATFNISTNVDLSGAGTLYATSPSGNTTTYPFSGINEQVFSKTLDVEEVGEWTFYYTYYGYGESGTSETVKHTITDEDAFKTINLTSNFAKLSITFNGKDNYPYYLRILNAENNVIYEDSNATFIDRMMMSTAEEVTVEVVQNDLWYFKRTINLNYKDNEVICDFPNIYGVQINETNPDPSSRCSYIADAEGFTGGSDEWDDTEIFDCITPILLDASGQYVNLDKNDFSKTEGGSDIYSISGEWDIMIRFPTLHYRIDKDNTNDILKFYISDSPFTRSNEWKCRNIGAYLGSTESGKLASKSNKKPTEYGSIENAKNYLNDKGSPYRLFHYYDLLMLQMLFILREKHTNPASFGVGNTNSADSTTTTLTGITDKKGMFFGSTSSNGGLKYLGIEDLWGNLCVWVDGLTLNSGSKTLDINGSTYTVVNSTLENQTKFLTVGLSAIFPFINKNANLEGSSSTYYCSHQALNIPTSGKYNAYMGGSYKTNGGHRNLFSISFKDSASASGARLVREV